MSDDVIDLGGEDPEEWEVAGITVGEYRRLHARIEADGRESLSPEELEQHDAVEAEWKQTGRRVTEMINRQLPDVSAALKRAGQGMIRRASGGGKSPLTESAIERGMPPRMPPPQLDDGLEEALADAQREKREREEAQLEALELIAGHVAKMKDAQVATTEELGSLRKETSESSKSSSRVGWWGVGIMAATFVLTAVGILVTVVVSNS